jgi:hypothetical protein
VTVTPPRVTELPDVNLTWAKADADELRIKIERIIFLIKTPGN